MKLREILIDIHALEEELLAFERKYGVRSETAGCWTLANGRAFTALGYPDKLSIATKFSAFNTILQALSV